MNVTILVLLQGEELIKTTKCQEKEVFFKKEGTLLQKKKTIFIRSSGKDVPDWFDPLNQTFIK